jgi:hypothetical protein
MHRLESAEDAEREGIRIAADLLREVRTIPGVAGAHLMTFGWVEGVEGVVRQAGEL